MRILVTGSRNYTSRKSIKDALERWTQGTAWRDITLVHGDCPTGADAIANSIAVQKGWKIERYPAQWHKHGKAAGPLRNGEMADAGADVCLAFPTADSKGTLDMIKKAKAADIPVNIYFPPDIDTYFT
jgi:hypothetical protein